MFSRKCFCATFHRKPHRLLSTTPNFVEIRIPVPWGHIAGKWWGPTDQRPILTLHGWQDNCGSFDLLIPKLPQNLGYLAIDTFGHGLSSKLPPGVFYYSMNGVLMVKKVKDYFKWDKISLMGHSLGAMFSYMYGFLFPSTVDFMICIDGFHTLVNRKATHKYVWSIEHFIKYDAHNSSGVEPPSYTYEELAVMHSKGLHHSLDLKKAKYILKRNIKPSETKPGRFYFSRDPRIKCGSLVMWSSEDVVEAAGRVNFPLFVSKAEKTPFFRAKDNFPQIYEVLRKSCPDFELHVVSGGHYGHINNPEIYEVIIPNFIHKFNTHDRSQVPIIDQIRAKL